LRIKYNPKLKKRAQELRKNATFVERFLWKYLKNRQLSGYKFMRQKPIDNYIVDFYCSKLKLAIEIDCITHIDKQKYDTFREQKLTELGLKSIPF
jgi:very-short-patch-repair endonuclease